MRALLQQVATYGLPGTVIAHGASGLGTESWERFLHAVDRQRLAGLLQAAVVNEDLEVTAEQRAAVGELHLRWCGSVLRLEHRLLELAATLESAGIEFVVLKGTAVAHLDYPDPAQRLFGDLDLLIRSEQLDESLARLSAEGYRRLQAQARPGFDRRFGKGATLLGPAGDELDIHRNLVFGTFGFAIELDELFDTAVTFEIAGHTMRALGPETRLLHACYHAALGDPVPRFSSVRDIAQMLLLGNAVQGRVLELSRRWNAEAVLARGLALCQDHLGLKLAVPLAERLEGFRFSRRERRAVSSYVGANRGFAAKVVASLPYLPSVRERAAFLRAIVAPDPDFVLSHGGRPGWAWLRRGMRSLLHEGSR